MVYVGAGFLKFIMVDIAKIEEEKADRVIKTLKGHLIYVRTKPQEYEEISKEYEKLKAIKKDENNILKILANRFQKTVKSIKNIINKYKQGELPLYGEE